MRRTAFSHARVRGKAAFLGRPAVAVIAARASAGPQLWPGRFLGIEKNKAEGLRSTFQFMVARCQDSLVFGASQALERQLSRSEVDRVRTAKSEVASETSRSGDDLRDHVNLNEPLPVLLQFREAFIPILDGEFCSALFAAQGRRNL